MWTYTENSLEECGTRQCDWEDFEDKYWRWDKNSKDYLEVIFQKIQQNPTKEDGNKTQAQPYIRLSRVCNYILSEIINHEELL